MSKLLVSGSAQSGVAIINAFSREEEVFANDALCRHRVVKKAVSKYDWERVLRISMFSANEKVLPDMFDERRQALVALLEAAKIRVVIPFGSMPLKAVSRLHGKPTKLLGATIEGEAVIPKGVKYVIPLDDESSGARALRSYSFKQQLIRFINRGMKLARQPMPLFNLAKVYYGESDEVLAGLRIVRDSRENIGLDLETCGEFPNQIITAIGLANSVVAVSVPWSGYESALYGTQVGLQRSDIREVVLEILAGPSTKLAHNGAFDFTVLQSLGIECGGEWEDTMIAHRINHSDLFHNLQFCVSMEVPAYPWKTAFEAGRRKRGEPSKDWSDVRYAEILPYNAWDAGVMPFLWEKQKAKLMLTHNGWENYQKMKQMSALFSKMKFHGIRIDEVARAETTVEAQAKLAIIEARWHELTGIYAAEVNKKMLNKLYKKQWKQRKGKWPKPVCIEVNAASPQQMAKLLFEILMAPVVTRSKKTEDGSLPSSTLLEYAYSGQAPLDITAWTAFEYRKLKKAIDAFLLALPAHRAYADANVAGTKGTRASYSRPNLQQISKPKELRHPFLAGKEGAKFQVAPALRHIFTPDPGMVMWELDYSALELRLVAMASGMHDVLEIIKDPSKDLHMMHVELMFRRKIDKSSDEGKALRQITKTLTYALFYNMKKNVETVFRSLKPSMPALTLARLEECAELFHQARPQLPRWQNGVKSYISEHGYVELSNGERQYHDRRYPDMNQALSYGIQSEGGLIVNGAMLRLDKRLDWERGERILIQVHDSLVGQCPPDRLEHVLGTVKEEMERPVFLWDEWRTVPVEGGSGLNWRDIKAVP